MLPSKGWFYPYLRWFKNQPDQGRKVITARYGKEVYENEYLIFDTFVHKATEPLQYVFADHWLMDVFIVDEATRSKVDRLWLTVLIDVYSRSILGIALLYETPCIESIQIALLNSIWPKTSHKLLGIEGEWPAYGIPMEFSLDNAWAHHSLSLENLAKRISLGGRFNSITLVFRPPYRGRYGAIIERFFGNLSGQVKEKLPGAIQSSHPKAIRNAAKNACFIYQDIYRFVLEEIVTYQNTPHSELNGLTPNEKWQEGLALTGPPLVPPLTEEVKRYFWRKYPKTGKINSQGISAFGMHYYSGILDGAARVNMDGSKVEYGISYDPSDISTIALIKEGQWLGDIYAKELKAPDGSPLSISLAERQMAQDLAIAKGKSARNWLASLNELDEQVKIRQAERKKALNQARSGSSTKSQLAKKVTHTETDAKVSSNKQKDKKTKLLLEFLK